MAVCGPGGHRGRSEGTTGEVRAGHETGSPAFEGGDLMALFRQYQKAGRGANPDWTWIPIITPPLSAEGV